MHIRHAAVLSLAVLAASLTPVTADAQTKALTAEAKANPPLIWRDRNDILFDGKLSKKEDARDVFRLPLKANEGVTITVKSRAIDSQVQIFAEDQTKGEIMLVEDDDSGGGRDAEVRFIPPGNRSGTFFVVVRSGSGPGAYTLEARKHEFAAPGPPVPLAFGASVKGKVDARSRWDNETGASFELFGFQGTAGDRIRATATPRDNASPLSLRIIGPEGPLPGRVTATEPLLVQTLASNGPHQLEVSFKVGRSESDAEFNVNIERLPAANFVAIAQPLVPGAPARGRFGPDSPILSPTNSHPYALYTVTGKRGQRFAARLEVDDPKSAGGSSPVFPMLDVGVDTPAGFAAVSSALPRTARPAQFEFQRDGEMQIRIVAATGADTGYILRLDLIEIVKVEAK